MAEYKDLWDGNKTYSLWVSGKTIYKNDDTTLSTIIPLTIGHTYIIKCVVKSDRYRWCTCSAHPNNVPDGSSGIRSIYSNDSVTEGYEFTFTAGTNENYLIGYIGHTTATPSAEYVVIQVFDTSIYENTGVYLIKSGSTFYTVTAGALTALSETNLTASLFLNSGFDSIPDSSLLVTLADPEVMFWTDGEDELPTLTATVTGTPFPQTVITNDVDMSDPTVLGIESVEIIASDDVLFAMSFDGGNTWKGYINQWVTLETENSGMTAAQFRNIPIEAWAQQATTGHYMVRFVLADAESYVENITVHYIN